MSFKHIDIFTQIAIPISAFIYFFLIENTLDGMLISVAILNGGVGIWQLLSVVIHLFFSNLIRLPKSRTVYYLLLLIALPICISPLLSLTTTDSVLPAMIMGAAMAIFYFIITVKEFRILRRNENR